MAGLGGARSTTCGTPQPHVAPNDIHFNTCQRAHCPRGVCRYYRASYEDDSAQEAKRQLSRQDSRREVLHRVRMALREKASRDTEAGREVDLDKLFASLGGVPSGGKSGRFRVTANRFIGAIRNLGIIIPAQDERELLLAIDPRQSKNISRNAFFEFLRADEFELYVVLGAQEFCGSSGFTWLLDVGCLQQKITSTATPQGPSL